MRRIGMLRSGTAASDKHSVAAFLDAMRELGWVIGVALDELRVTSADDLQRAFRALERRRPDALYVIIDTRIGPYRKIIADEALRLNIPSMSGYRGYVEVGGLMSYAASLSELYRRGATYVDRIFKGAKPGNLAIELPSKYELIFNLKTAKLICLAIPPSLLLRAGEVIQ